MTLNDEFPLPNMNEEALEYVYDLLSKDLLKNKNSPK